MVQIEMPQVEVEVEGKDELPTPAQAPAPSSGGLAVPKTEKKGVSFSETVEEIDTKPAEKTEAEKAKEAEEKKA
jgi:hypothetical protein